MRDAYNHAVHIVFEGGGILVEPGDGAFDNPAPGSQTTAMRGAAFGKEGFDAFVFKARAEGGTVIRAVSVQAQDFAAQAIRQRCKQGEKIAAVMPVAPLNQSSPPSRF